MPKLRSATGRDGTTADFEPFKGWSETLSLIEPGELRFAQVSAKPNFDETLTEISLSSGHTYEDSTDQKLRRLVLSEAEAKDLSAELEEGLLGSKISLSPHEYFDTLGFSTNEDEIGAKGAGTRFTGTISFER